MIEAQVERLEEGFLGALEAARGDLRADVCPQRLARALISSYYGVGLLASRVADTVSVMLELVENGASDSPSMIQVGSGRRLE